MNDVMQQIHDAEAQAAKIKADALEQAALIAARAEADAAEIEKKSAEKRKVCREQQLKQAELAAQEHYETELKKQSAEAKAYADSLIEKADLYVGEIVRRVSGGTC